MQKETTNFSINLCLTCRCQFLYCAYASFLGLISIQQCVLATNCSPAPLHRTRKSFSSQIGLRREADKRNRIAKIWVCDTYTIRAVQLCVWSTYNNQVHICCNGCYVHFEHGKFTDLMISWAWTWAFRTMCLCANSKCKMVFRAG